MEIKVRKFQVSDARRLVQILQLNGQYDDPEIEGETAMKRVAACGAALIFVAEIDARPCGFIKAVYDGSRALIHLLSIHLNLYLFHLTCSSLCKHPDCIHNNYFYQNRNADKNEY